MRILLCLYQRLSQHQRRAHKGDAPAQVLVIFAVMALGIIIIVGLSIDVGSVYVTYDQLKRAVDSAAISAANEFKTGQTLDNMNAAAYEMLNFHNVDMTQVDMHVFICDNYNADEDQDLVEPYGGDPDGMRDRYLQTEQPLFYDRCPNTESGLQPPRKLVWVDAVQQAPVYFLRLLGIQSVPLRTNAIAEAAPVDLVLVIDISESMASETVDASGNPAYVVGNFDPAACNDSNTCQPLKDAKEAAILLVEKMHNGYDRVGVVTFDATAMTHPIENTHGVTTGLSDDMENVIEVIENIKLHDDPPFVRMWRNWWQLPGGYAFNPVNPEDRDGDGQDADPKLPTCNNNPMHPLCCMLDDDRWDENPARFSANYPWGGGFPCDDDSVYDSHDWNGDGVYSIEDHNGIVDFLDPDGDNIANNTLSPLSTCTGCGIREASSILTTTGRSNSVWVMVFLSDGAVNLSDMPPEHIDAGFTNGFCYGEPLNNPMWAELCRDQSLSPRVCIDSSSATCPPGSSYENSSIIPYEDLTYSPYDYALDMVDAAALLFSTNPDETPGNNIGIYTVGLGDVGTIGESLLRYMASVGDDGDRTSDPCSGKPSSKSCGQYYYAPSGEDLLPIFEDIASRIYTRLTQ